MVNYNPKFMITFAAALIYLISSPLWAGETSAKVEPVPQEQVPPTRQEKLLQELLSRIQPDKSKEAPNQILMSKEIVMIDKTISGQISGRGTNGVAIVYEKNQDKKSAKEMWFPFSDAIELQGYKVRTDIKEGDEVDINYEEADDESIRVLKSISLTKRIEEPTGEPLADKKGQTEEQVKIERGLE